MANGEWISAPKGDFEKDPNTEVVYEDGQPSYFREKIPGPVSTSRLDLNEQQALAASTLASCSPVDKSKEEKVAELVRALSRDSALRVRDNEGELVNPFLGSEDPLLDPNSGKFSARAWLHTLMSIESRDPERYPRRVAGVAYKNLSVHGFGEPTDYQRTFGNYPWVLLNHAKRILGRGQKTRIQILRDFDGLVKSGELLVVLGSPGSYVFEAHIASVANVCSGCSTLLKTISGETDGFFVGDDSYLNYQGIPKETMHNDFRGECIYQAEADIHFPQLTVSQTLEFAARARVG
jgi:ATP-binding cassette subfamily G (WHITE) protein 2 (PDR)